MPREIKFRDKRHNKHRKTVREWRATHEFRGLTYKKVRGKWKWVRKKSTLEK